jgi:hypothetical protein
MNLLRDLFGVRHQPVVLAPYTHDPKVGWRRWRLPLLLLAVAFICPIYGFYYALTTPYLLVQFTFPLILLAALTIWALPELGRAPTKLLEAFFFAFFTAMILWPNYLAISLPGLPWITVLRLTGFPLALILLISVSISKDFRGHLRDSLTSVPLLWKFMAGFVATQLISLFMSNQPSTSINKIINSQVSWTAIFFVSAFVFLKPKRAEAWAFLFWGMGIALGLIAMKEASLGRPPWAGHIPSFLAVEDESVQRVLTGGSRLGLKYRTQATYTTALGLAEYMALLTPFLYHFMAGPFRLLIRLAAAATLPFIFYIIILTDSRLGVVGFIIGSLLYLLFWGATQWRQRKGSLIGPAVVFAYPVFFTLMMAATFVFGRLRAMVWGGGQHAASNDARADQVQAGLPLVFTHPFGHGAGIGGTALGFRNAAGTLTIDNYYLLIALDYGILGFLLYYGLIALTIGNSSKYALTMTPRHRDQTFLIPIAIALTSFFIIKSIFSQTENHPIAFMMVGMAAALIYRLKTDTKNASV